MTNTDFTTIVAIDSLETYENVEPMTLAQQ